MKIKVSIIVIFLGILFLMPMTAICRQYRIATVAWIGWSPLHVAQDRGFWKEQGIDVKVMNYDDPIVILEAIKAEKIDLAMDMVGSLVGLYMKGVPVLALAETNWSDGGDKIIVRNGTRLEEYTGHTIGVFLHQPSCLFFLDRYLKTKNLQLSNFRIVEINSHDLSAQFVAGRLPIIVNYEPWAGQAVRDGNGLVLASSADFKGCIPECMWGYKPVVNGIPETDIQMILKGWIKAVEWMKNTDNQVAYYRILGHQTFSGQRNLTSEDYTRMLDAVAIHGSVQLLERNKRSGGLEKYLEELKLFLNENGMLKKDYHPGDIFNNRYIMAVLKNE